MLVLAPNRRAMADDYPRCQQWEENLQPPASSQKNMRNWRDTRVDKTQPSHTRGSGLPPISPYPYPFPRPDLP